MPLVAGVNYITRSSKGAELTHEEMDANFEAIADMLNGLEQVGAQVYDPEYPLVRLNQINPQTRAESSFVFGSGATFGFTHHTGLKFYGQGHPDAAANLGKVLNIVGGGARVIMWGRLLNYNGDITLYYRKNGAGGYTALHAWNSDVGSNAEASAFRDENTITGLAKTDYIELFVAPCNGSGTISSPQTLRYELEVLALNWR